MESDDTKFIYFLAKKLKIRKLKNKELKRYESLFDYFFIYLLN